MVASIGAIASPAQGVSYYERDGYYAKEDPAHREASAWAGKGADALGLSGSVDPDVFSDILEGAVPDGSGRRLGRRLGDGEISHRPGRDVTFSASKSVSIAALIGGDERVVAAHDSAVRKTLAWIEENVVETRTMDAESGRMVRAGGQKAVIATFRHEVSRNLDPQLHTHAVIANMVQGEDAKWRTMANEKLYASKMLIGALYRAELARGLEELGYAIEKTHADGRFEIAGAPGRFPVSRSIVEAFSFSTRRGEIEAAMDARGLGEPGSNPHLAARVALMTRAHKREVDRDALRESWQRQASELGFDAPRLVDEARHRQAAYGNRPLAHAGHDREAEPGTTTEADRAAAWAVAHLSEREAVFSRTDLLTSALAWKPGKVSIGEAEAAVTRLEKAGTLLAADYPVPGDSLTTDRTAADERETIALMERGQGRGAAPMRGRAVDKALRNSPLTAGQKEAVKLILSEKDRVVGVQGFAGTGKTTMLNRARALLEKRGFEVRGLAPSASAARTLNAEAGIASETLQGFLARNAGVAEGRLSHRGEHAMKARFSKTVLVVDEGSLASTVQTRDLLRIANTLRIPRVVLVGDEKQLDAVDAGKPFAQLQGAERGKDVLLQNEAPLRRRRRPAAQRDVLRQIPLRDLRHRRPRRRLRRQRRRNWVLARLHSRDHQRRTLARLLRRDHAVAADGDPSRPPLHARLGDIHLASRGVGPNAEARYLAVPVDRVLPGRQRLHRALRDALALQLRHARASSASTSDRPFRPSPPGAEAATRCAPMLPPTLAADAFSVSRARCA